MLFTLISIHLATKEKLATLRNEVSYLDHKISVDSFYILKAILQIFLNINVLIITLTVSCTTHEDRPLIVPWDSRYFDIWGLLFSF